MISVFLYLFVSLRVFCRVCYCSCCIHAYKTDNDDDGVDDDDDDDDDEDDCKIINEYSCTPKWHVPWRNENFTYYGFEVIHGLKFSLQDFQLTRSSALFL